MRDKGKKDDNKNKFMNLILSHRLEITIVLVLIPIVIFFLSIILLEGNIIDTDNSRIENTYYIAQILSSIFVISGVVVAVWQYFLTSRSQLTQINIEQIQKAIDLSEYYKDNILEKYGPIYHVYESSGILEIINSIDKNKIQEFDIAEAGELFNKNQLNELDKIQYSEKFIKAVIETYRVYNLFPETDIFEKVEKVNEDGEKEQLIRVDLKKLILSFMHNNVNSILNNMEYFATNFSHNTADDSVVYQSLHQTYIEIVRILYYNIAKLNKPLQTKYYTNVIELYNKWNKKRDDQLKKMKEGSRNMVDKGKIVDLKKD